jgi:hypothetical protein
MRQVARESVAGERGPRKQAMEFLVMLLLGGPGIALAFWGFKLLEAKHGFDLPAVLLIAFGAMLLLSMGLYHYSRDFKGAYSSRAKSIAGYLIIVVGGGVVGVLLKTLLFRIFRH